MLPQERTHNGRAMRQIKRIIDQSRSEPDFNDMSRTNLIRELHYLRRFCKNFIAFLEIMFVVALIVCAGMLLKGCGTAAWAGEIPYSEETLANAILKAENSPNHPYGIMAHYKRTTPRQACLNTIMTAEKKFNKQNKDKNFIHFLSLTYCPIGCNNDNGTNKFWVNNVTFFYNKLALCTLQNHFDFIKKLQERIRELEDRIK